MWKQKLISIHVLRTLLGLHRIILYHPGKTMYRNYHTVGGVTVLNLKAHQALQLQFESHADGVNAYSTALHQE